MGSTVVIQLVRAMAVDPGCLLVAGVRLDGRSSHLCRCYFEKRQWVDSVVEGRGPQTHKEIWRDKYGTLIPSSKLEADK